MADEKKYRRKTMISDKANAFEVETESDQLGWSSFWVKGDWGRSLIITLANLALKAVQTVDMKSTFSANVAVRSPNFKSQLL